MTEGKLELTHNDDSIIIIPDEESLERIMRHIIGICSYTKIKRHVVHDVVDKIYDEYE